MGAKETASAPPASFTVANDARSVSRASAEREEFASVKRRVRGVEKQLKAFSKALGRDLVKTTEDLATESDANANGLRLRAEVMASNRKRLGLSAADFGLLVGTTGQSVYSWEQRKSKPRAKVLAAIAALRGGGESEGAKRVEALKHSGGWGMGENSTNALRAAASSGDSERYTGRAMAHRERRSVEELERALRRGRPAAAPV